MKKRFLTSSLVSISAILLSCVGAISVGFASWIISQGDAVTTTGNINADTINTNIKGVSIVGEPLTIGHYHYDNGNGSYSDTTTLTYKISYTKSLINVSSMTLKGSLSFGNGLTIFKSDYFESITYDSVAVTPSYHQSETAVEFTITQAIGNSDIPNKELVFEINNKMIAKWGSQMDGSSFYLRLEVE